MNADEERELVVLSRKGDRAAYAGLVKTYSGPVFAICLGMLGNRHDAEDTTQQTLLKGFVQIRTLRDSDRFAPWIARIARNLCLDVLRRRRYEGLSPTPDDNRPGGDPDDFHRLEKALSKLSVDYRVPLLLFYVDGRSTQSIAETLGISHANVQTRLSRARKQLRRLLESEGDDP
ncbi:MAG: sigma-70 family RNA polymerase sigma factor [Phycisphaerales bacterium]